jgi:hypothetical protein
MIDASELNVQITLSIGELRNLVALINLAADQLPEADVPEVVGDVSGLYFELMQNLKDGYLGDFEPE